MFKQEEVVSNSKSLNMAISVADVAKVRALLLEHPFCINTADDEGEYPLHMAVRKDNMDVLDLLLRQPNINYNIKECNSGNSPLITAMMAGQMQMFETLLHFIAVDIEQTNNNGWTPLLASILLDKQEYFELMLPEYCEDTLENMYLVDRTLPNSTNTTLLTCLIENNRYSYIDFAMSHFDLKAEHVISLRNKYCPYEQMLEQIYAEHNHSGFECIKIPTKIKADNFSKHLVGKLSNYRR